MLYKYQGPVYRFENIVIPKWVMYTHASSKAQALNNLKFKAKKVLKLNKMAKVDLKGKYITEVHTVKEFVGNGYYTSYIDHKIDDMKGDDF